MNEYKATIVCTAPSGPDDYDVSISLVEDESRISFLEIRMTLEEFGRMLHAPTIASCTVITRGLDRLGWKAETKTEAVTIEGYAPDAGAVNEALRPFEVDGWRGRRRDIGNSHRRTKDGFRVLFDRHVPPASR